MAWIEYHTALRDHWKIKRLSDELEIEYTTALGAISCLWLWCAEYSPTGDLRRFTDEEIRFAARTECKKFTKSALNTCGLLTEGQYINDWGKHGLKLLKSKRLANKKYMRKKRSSGYPQDTQRIAIPDRTRPYQTRPRQSNQKPGLDPLGLKDLFASELFKNVTHNQKTALMDEYPADFLAERLGHYVSGAARNGVFRMSAARLFEWLHADFETKTRRKEKADAASGWDKPFPAKG